MKVKWGALMTDGRGKIGGQVASKNSSGSYMRTKVTPSNPQSSAQTAVRNRFTGLSQDWRGLTDAQRDSWNSSVSSFTSTDIFGDNLTPSGFNLYVAINMNLLNVGSAQISVPPVPSEVGYFTAFTAAAAAGAQTMTLTFAPVIPAGSDVIIRATPAMSPGISFVKSEYRQITVLENGDLTGLTIAAPYIAVHGAIGAAGQKIHFQALWVNNTTGQSGTVLSTSSIIAA
jgi:hypothetical protein